MLLKDLGPHKKGQLLNSFEGILTGITIKQNGKRKEYLFTDKEYFKSLDDVQ